MVKGLRCAELTPPCVDSKHRCLRSCNQMQDDDLPRPRGDAADKLSGEDLAPYSQDELTERINLLKTEISRVEAHRDTASAHRKAADALFGKPS